MSPGASLVAVVALAAEFRRRSSRGQFTLLGDSIAFESLTITSNDVKHTPAQRLVDGDYSAKAITEQLTRFCSILSPSCRKTGV